MIFAWLLGIHIIGFFLAVLITFSKNLGRAEYRLGKRKLGRTGSLYYYLSLIIFFAQQTLDYDSDYVWLGFKKLLPKIRGWNDQVQTPSPGVPKRSTPKTGNVRKRRIRSDCSESAGAKR